MATEEQTTEKDIRKLLVHDLKLAKKVVFSMINGNNYDIDIGTNFYNLEFVQEWLRIEKKNFIFTLKLDQISEITIEY